LTEGVPVTDSERRLLIEKCGQLLHQVLVEIRALSYQEGQAGRINYLADLTHNIPLFMVGRDEHLLGYLRDGFMAYARKYHPDLDPERSRYVMLLDMDETLFNDLYRRTSWSWPEAAGARG
jgi:hypothetical protein